MSVKENNEPNQTTRIEAFSDGVFAIAITLLVLEIHVPEVSGDESLLKPLLENWTSYLGFLIGFFTILICWINHHYMFELINKSDGMLLLLNGFKLLVVSFTPFATAILSKYINTPQQGMAVIIYASNFALMGLAMFFIFMYARNKGFMYSTSPEQLRATSLLYTLAPTFSVSICLLSFVSTIGALALSGIMFSVFLFPKVTDAWILSIKEKNLSLRGTAKQN